MGTNIVKIADVAVLSIGLPDRFIEPGILGRNGCGKTCLLKLIFGEMATYYWEIIEILMI